MQAPWRARHTDADVGCDPGWRRSACVALPPRPSGRSPTARDEPPRFDLDQLRPQRRHRPGLHASRQNQPTQEVDQVAGQGEQLQPYLIVHEVVAGKPGPLDRDLCWLHSHSAITPAPDRPCGRSRRSDGSRCIRSVRYMPSLPGVRRSRSRSYPGRGSTCPGNGVGESDQPTSPAGSSAPSGSCWWSESPSRSGPSGWWRQPGDPFPALQQTGAWPDQRSVVPRRSRPRKPPAD